MIMALLKVDSCQSIAFGPEFGLWCGDMGQCVDIGNRFDILVLVNKKYIQS